MHTYIRHENGTYDVGLWLPGIEGRTSFTRLFTLHSWHQAVQAVCYLNGGEGDFNAFAPKPGDEA